MKITNVQVYNANSNKFNDATIIIDNNKIRNIEYKNTKKYKKYAIPGLIDVHLHGALGFEFATTEYKNMSKISIYEAQNGITTICPTFLTLPLNTLQIAAKNVNELKNRKKNEAYFVGINLEGPFVSKKKLGAQNPKYAINPNDEFIKKITDIVEVKLLDLAPELKGGIDFIKKHSKKINISIAHTIANFAIAEKAIQCGANHITHLFNAMPELSHKDPSVIGAAYKYKDIVFPELIADSIHVHNEVVKITFEIFKNIVLVSDSMKATGLKDGESEIGGQKVIIKNKEARLKNNGALAGSVFNLFDCFINSINNINISLENAVKAVTVNPAKSIGIYNDFGSIDCGKIANILILDNNLKINQIILGGKLL